MSTRIRSSLRSSSSLLGHTQDGLGAVQAKHKNGHIDAGIRSEFCDSIDLDAALQPQFPSENRWDYLLGHDGSQAIVGLEPHSAYNKEISVVIQKRQAALRQLRGHLKNGQRVAAWYWVASGKVDFLPHEKALLRLEQAGIAFVGRKLKSRDLPKKQGAKKQGAKKQGAKKRAR